MAERQGQGVEGQVSNQAGRPQVFFNSIFASQTSLGWTWLGWHLLLSWSLDTRQDVSGLCPRYIITCVSVNIWHCPTVISFSTSWYWIFRINHDILSLPLSSRCLVRQIKEKLFLILKFLEENHSATSRIPLFYWAGKIVELQNTPWE